MPSESELAVGDRVEAAYRKGTSYFPGKISKYHASSGTFDIAYDDGDREEHVLRANIRSLVKKELFHMGQCVQARYKRSFRFFPGVITRVNGDLYDIKYDDGDTESGVLEADIEALAHKVPAKQITFEANEAITASFKDSAPFVLGKILKKRNRNAYDVEFITGEIEKRVAAERILRLEPSTAENRSFRVNERVCAMKKSDEKWYFGRVLKVNDAYDIEFDDGELEVRVDIARILAITTEEVAEDVDKEVIAVADGMEEAVVKPVETQEVAGAKMVGTQEEHASIENLSIPEHIWLLEQLAMAMFSAERMQTRPMDAEHAPLLPDVASAVGYFFPTSILEGTFTGVMNEAEALTAIDRELKSLIDKDQALLPAQSLLNGYFERTQNIQPISIPDCILALAFAYDRHVKSVFHEPKAEVFRETLGNRLFQVLQQRFHEASRDRSHIPRVYVHQLPSILASMPESLNLKARLFELHLQPYHFLFFAEFLALHTAKSTVNSTEDMMHLPSVALLAANLFIQSSDSINEEQVVQKLCTGRTELQKQAILHLHTLFQSFFQTPIEKTERLIPVSKLVLVLKEMSEGNAFLLERAISAIQQRCSQVSLSELYASLGPYFDDMAAAPSISNAVEKLRLHNRVEHMRSILSLVRNVCLKALRHPEDPRYWRLLIKSQAFQTKFQPFEGAMDLLRAVGFSPSADGVFLELAKQISILRVHCTELERQLAALDGVDSLLSIFQRYSASAKESLSLDTCKNTLIHLATYVQSVLQDPKDSRRWRIRTANPVFQKHMEPLPMPFVRDFMGAIGYDTVTPEFLQLRSAKTRVPEAMEWFLWRRLQEVQALLSDNLLLVRTAISFPLEKPKRTMQEEMLFEIFERLKGSNGGSFLTRNGFETAVEALGCGKLGAWLRFNAFDVNQDDSIDWNEFVAAFDAVLKPCTAEKSLAYALSRRIGSLRIAMTCANAYAVLCSLYSILYAMLKFPAKSQRFSELQQGGKSLHPLLFQVPSGQTLLRFIGLQKSSKYWRKDATSDTRSRQRQRNVLSLLRVHLRALFFSPNFSDPIVITRAIAFHSQSERKPWKKLLQILLRCMDNILGENSKKLDVSRIHMKNELFQTFVDRVKGGKELFLSVGFMESDSILFFPEASSRHALEKRRLELAEALFSL